MMNIYKFLIMGLASSLLLTACGDDTSNANNGNNGTANNGNNGNNGTAGNNGNNGANNKNNLPGEEPDPTGCNTLDQQRADSGKALPEDTCWLASSALFLTSETLTIEEGVIIYFAENAFLAVQGDARLVVEGSDDSPVFFTRAEKGVTWNGLQVGSNSSKNSIDHAIIEYTNDDAALTVTAGGKLAVTNSIIRLSEGTGVLGSGELSIADTIITETNTPMEISLSNMSTIGDGNDFSGNTKDFIEVASGTIQEDATWREANVPYLLDGLFNIESNLTITAGAAFTMKADSGFEIRTSGSLSAIGTDEAHIVFASQDDEEGFWKGIHFASPSSDNALDYVDIFGGGTAGWTGSADSKAAVYVDGGSRLTISNSTFKASAWYALFLGDNTGSAEVTLNTSNITQNTRIAMVTAETVVGIGEDNTFAGNDENGIRIQRDINVDTEWAKIDVPWLIYGGLTVDAELTIAAGSTLEFAADKGLVTYWAGSAGKIIAEGTTEDPILFTGIDKSAGYWQGIGTFSPGSVLKNVVIEYGGSGGFHGGDVSNAALGVMDSTTLDMDGVTIKDSAGFGIYYEDTATLTCNNMTFTNNARGNFSGDVVTCM